MFVLVSVLLLLCVGGSAVALVAYFARHKPINNDSAGNNSIAAKGADNKQQSIRPPQPESGKIADNKQSRPPEPEAGKGTADKQPSKRSPEPLHLSDDAALDQLAMLLSHDHFVGHRRNRRLDDKQFVEAVTKLGKVRGGPVAAAVAAAKEPLEMRSQLVTLKMKTDAENRALVEKAAAEGGTLFPGFDRWADDGDLDEAVRLNRLSQDDAAEYRRARGEAKSALFKGWNAVLTAGGKGLQMDAIARRVHDRAEALESEVFKKHLLPALQARAGGKVGRPVVDLYFFLGSSESAVYGANVNGSVSVHSRANQELTRLTLIIDIPSRVCVYIPKLKVNEPFRLAPFDIDFTQPKFANGFNPQQLRYSIYCDQFRVENQGPSPAQDRALLEYGFCKLAADSEYYCEKLRNQPFYRLAFKDMQPTNTGYRCTAQLDQYDAIDKTKITASSIYKGTIEPGVSMPGVLLSALQLTLTGGGKTMQVKMYLERDGQLTWDTWKGAPLEGLGLISAAAFKAREVDTRKGK